MYTRNIVYATMWKRLGRREHTLDMYPVAVTSMQKACTSRWPVDIPLRSCRCTHMSFQCHLMVIPVLFQLRRENLTRHAIALLNRHMILQNPYGPNLQQAIQYASIPANFLPNWDNTGRSDGTGIFAQAGSGLPSRVGGSLETNFG